MITPKNESEDLIFSISKYCKTLIIQTHMKPQETFKFRLSKPRETFSFKPSDIFVLDSKLMIILTSLVVYNSL